MERNTKIIIIILALIVIGGAIFLETQNYNEIEYTTLGNTSIGTVEVGISGNENATKCIALITGIHPREELSIDPEIEAAKQFGNDDVKIIHYKVTVTQNPEDYNEGRANGESLVHDYVNPHVTTSDADERGSRAGFLSGFERADGLSVKIFLPVCIEFVAQNQRCMFNIC